jgi:NADH-quinone oxidoreductase subunit E
MLLSYFGGSMVLTPSQSVLPLEEQSFIDRVVAAHTGKPGALLGVLERVQEHEPHKFLSPDVLEYIADRMDLPLAQIFSVVTFFALFNLEAQGDHTICICRGTACHTRGSRNLLQRLRLELGLPEESQEGADKLCVTTPDGKYSLRTVACFGQCALAPVVEVDHAVFGHMNEQTLHREIEHLSGRKA